jgi:hypothetical protein
MDVGGSSFGLFKALLPNATGGTGENQNKFRLLAEIPRRTLKSGR